MSEIKTKRTTKENLKDTNLFELAKDTSGSITKGLDPNELVRRVDNMYLELEDLISGLNAKCRL